MVQQSEFIEGTEKEFLNVFKSLCYARNSWEVWADIITVIACSLSNAIYRTEGHFEKREKEYEDCIKRIGSVEIPAKLMGILVMALESNPDQDFLGNMYMSLGLGNHWSGQFFTPYNVCKCMAEITIGDSCISEIDSKGYITINDPCCGAGATLIAAANTIKRKGINYQNHVVFVGQDIDRIVGLMCYIQLSLLGCPGYIVIANTLSNPICGPVLNPNEKESQEFWYTPFYNTPIWSGRRLINALRPNEIGNKPVNEDNTFCVNLKERFYFFIQFYKKGKSCMNENNLQKKIFNSGADKLAYEEQELLKTVSAEKRDVIKQQFDLVFQELIKRCKENEDFNQMVLQEHKTWERCYKFMEKKAMDVTAKGAQSCAIISTTLFDWIKEYYSIDDKSQIEKEDADRKKAEEERKKVATAIIDTSKTNMNQTVPMEKKLNNAVKKNEIEGQVSIFDTI